MTFPHPRPPIQLELRAASGEASGSILPLSSPLAGGTDRRHKVLSRKGPTYFVTWGDAALIGLSSQQLAGAVWGGEGHLLEAVSRNPASGTCCRTHALFQAGKWRLREMKPLAPDPQVGDPGTAAPRDVPMRQLCLCSEALSSELARFLPTLLTGAWNPTGHPLSS